MLKKAIIIQSLFFTAAAVLVLSSLGLLVFIGYNGLATFRYISAFDFFFCTAWDQNTPEFGVLPLLYGSMATMVITLILSAPLALLVSFFMVEVASGPVRRVMRTVIELFASLPSVIYGFLGLVLI